MENGKGRKKEQKPCVEMLCIKAATAGLYWLPSICPNNETRRPIYPPPLTARRSIRAVWSQTQPLMDELQINRSPITGKHP